MLDITDDDAPARIDDELLAREVIRQNGRIVCVSSIGIAGNAGQANYATDVAETIAWFASPASGGVNGNVVRVCAQSQIGA